MEINSGDTAWILVSTALVLIMTPALAFFYGGMVRRKNVLSTLVLSVIMMALISIQWVLVGYTLAFGPSVGGIVGNLDFLGLSGVGAAPGDYAPTVPHLAFAAYQMMFAIITPALITGAFVERVRFKAFIIFSLLWATLIYDPVAHWVWGSGGVLGNLGALDFAGGTVVHITAGVSALAFALVIGPRQGYKQWPSMGPSNIPFTVLGAGLLWMGWFGFNGGSALAADGVAVNAVVTTNTAAASAALVWMILAWLDEKPSVLGIVTGAVVGLVAITPGAGFVTPLAAIAIGGVGAAISYYTIRVVKGRTKIDESLDVFACHGMGGLWGALATGLFATTTVNEGGANGLFYGNPGQLAIQAVAAATVIGFSLAMTYAIAWILNKTIRLRVSDTEEQIGLDISEHRERAYG
jgi:Amt family ammonium transporter